MEHAHHPSLAGRLPSITIVEAVRPPPEPHSRRRGLRWALLLAALLITPGLSTLGLVMAAGSGDAAHRSAPTPADQHTQAHEDTALDGGMWHTVSDGETLRTIARRYYGTSRLWRAVQLANDAPQHPADGTQLWLPAIIPEL